MRGERAARLLAAAALAWCAACTPQYVKEDRTDRRPRELQVVQHSGGTHHVTAVVGPRWVQTFGNELLVIDVTTGRELGRAEGVPFGEGGALTDLVVEGDHAWAVSDRTALVEFDISENADPRVSATVTAEELGIEPRLVSRAGGETWVSGPGGVVRLSDRKVFLKDKPAGRVVQTPAGPACTSGRRILMLEDERYLGAATQLAELPSGIGPPGGYVFVLQGTNGASVGMMTGAFAETSHRAVPALVRRVRVLGDRIFAVTDRIIHTWRIQGLELVEPEEIPLRGGRDIARIRPNHYAVAGSFGRAMYRHRAEERRDGDTFYNVERSPGLLEVAMTDGRRILAGGREGFWLWRIGGTPEITDKTTDLVSVNDPECAASWGTAKLIKEKDESGNKVAKAVEFRHGGTVERWEPPAGSLVNVIELVDGDVWIGHDLGVDVVRRVDAVPADASEPAAPAPAAGTTAASKADPDAAAARPASPGRLDTVRSFRFEGPPLFIYPERIGGGASIVALHGGFILVKPVAVGDAPVFEGRGEIQ